MNTKILTCCAALAAIFVPSLQAAPPANDNFANAVLITGPTGTIPGTNAEATLQSGEPSYGFRTIWYSWTAPAGGLVTFNTIGSGFDTVMGVYTGSAVNALAVVGQNDDSAGNGESLVSFSATSGQVYHVSVASYAASHPGAATVLNWNQPVPAPNDNFAAAEVITGASGSLQGDQNIAGTESGEPGSGVQSVWYAWTAPATGKVVFDTLGTQYDTRLELYTGAAVNALTLVGSNNDWGYDGYGQSLVKVSVTGGTTYLVRVAMVYNYQPGVPFTLSWLMVSPPANDHFANAEVITGASGSVVANTFEATLEDIEPNLNGDSRSIWYAWTAPFTGVVVFDTFGSAYNATLSVVSNGDANALNYVCDSYGFPASCTVPVVSGTTYRICLATDPEIRVRLNWAENTVFVPSVISLAQASYNATEGGPAVQVMLNRNGGTNTGPVSCYLVTLNGSASGDDYAETYSQVNFADGVTTASVSIPIYQDRRFEGEESFQVRLFQPTLNEAAFGLSLATVNIADDEPFIPLKANYTGLVQVTPFDSALTGSLKLNATGNGSFTGSLALFGGKPLSINGSFNATGKFTQTLVRPGGNVLLNLSYADNGNRIRALVTVGNKTADIQAWRVIFGGAVEISEKAFAFTSLVTAPMSAVGDVPKAQGFLSISVSTKGLVKIVGCLPDDTTFTASGPMAGYDAFPLYASLYGGKGCFISDLMINEGIANVSECSWHKLPNINDKAFKGGVTQQRTVENSPYVFSKRNPILPGVLATQGAADFFVVGPGLPVNGAGQVFRLLENNSIALPLSPAVKLTLKFVHGTGFFTGTWQVGTAKAVAFKGAVFQEFNYAGGYYLGAATLGGVLSNGFIDITPAYDF